ncbi:ASTA-R [Mytilus edulis]|uniref:ASTA-R n=1 Tax=Mytilus edulis TaxID=6550 RepID=A0A8S3PWR7_MYTED|nr:ASTA-R [Mytilus edulis]
MVEKCSRLVSKVEGAFNQTIRPIKHDQPHSVIYHISASEIAEELALIETQVDIQCILELILLIIYGLTIQVGCLGNLFVIIAVCSQRQKENTTGIFIVNLAVIEFLYIMVYVPFIVTTYFKGSRVFGDIVCKLSNYLLYVSATISVNTLVLMSVDCYLAIVHPVTSKNSEPDGMLTWSF